MLEFLVRGTQAEKKGVQDSCLHINIIDLNSFVGLYKLTKIPNYLVF
jgi:hypothetical protein